MDTRFVLEQCDRCIGCGWIELPRDAGTAPCPQCSGEGHLKREEEIAEETESLRRQLAKRWASNSFLRLLSGLLGD